jgi:hypothetical protein
MAQGLDEGVCAACGKPLGIRANWRTIDGRAFHSNCEPAPESPKRESAPDNVLQMSKFDKAARNVLHGKGQRTLGEDTDV